MAAASVMSFLFDGLTALHGGPLDDASGFIFFREIYGHLDGMVKRFGFDLFGRMQAWVCAVATSLLTLWMGVEGYRIVIGRSQRSMTAFAAEMMQVVTIIALAAGAALGGVTLYDWAGHDLGRLVHRVLTGQTGEVFESIDRTLGYMQLAFGFIDEIQAGDNGALQHAKERNMAIVAVGMGGPAVIAGALLLTYKLALALCLGFAPLFVLCLLFPQTKPLFWGWLNQLVGALFALSVLHVMAAIATNMICAVAATFWTAKLTGASVEGVNSLAMQQGGLGLLLTTLIIGAPLMAAKFFKALLGDFSPYSAFGQGGAGRASAAHAAHPQAEARTYVHPGERPQAPVQPHAHRVATPARATAQEDKSKPAEDTRSFLERYPNATASLGGRGGNGDPLPESLGSLLPGPAVENPIRRFTADGLEYVATTRIKTPGGQIKEDYPIIPSTSDEYQSVDGRHAKNKQAIIDALNALGERLVERGIQEEVLAFNSIKHIAIEANPGRAHDATYSAKAIYGMGMILINPDLFSEMNDFRQRNKIAHEFYHIMNASSEKLKDNYRPAGSDPEDDADKFAIEIFGQESI